MNRHSRNSRFLSTALAVAMMGCFAEAAGTATNENPAGVSAKRQPVNYIVKEKSLVGNELFEAGQTVAYDGLPAENLIPTCDEGRARYQEYLDSNKQRVTTMIDQNKDGVGDPAAFMAALLTQQKADSDERDAKMASMIGQGIAQAFAAFFPNGIQVAAPAPVVEPVAAVVAAPVVADTPAVTGAVAAPVVALDGAADGAADPTAPAKRTKTS